MIITESLLFFCTTRAISPPTLRRRHCLPSTTTSVTHSPLLLYRRQFTVCYHEGFLLVQIFPLAGNSHPIDTASKGLIFTIQFITMIPHFSDFTVSPSFSKALPCQRLLFFLKSSLIQRSLLPYANTLVIVMIFLGVVPKTGGIRVTVSSKKLNKIKPSPRINTSFVCRQHPRFGRAGFVLLWLTVMSTLYIITVHPDTSVTIVPLPTLCAPGRHFCWLKMSHRASSFPR